MTKSVRAVFRYFGNLKWCVRIAEENGGKTRYSQFIVMAIHFDLGRLSFVNSVIPVIEYTIIQTLFIPGRYDCYFIFLLLLMIIIYIFC